MRLLGYVAGVDAPNTTAVGGGTSGSVRWWRHGERTGRSAAASWDESDDGETRVRPPRRRRRKTRRSRRSCCAWPRWGCCGWLICVVVGLMAVGMLTLVADYLMHREVGMWMAAPAPTVGLDELGSAWNGTVAVGDDLAHGHGGNGSSRQVFGDLLAVLHRDDEV